jgi:dethiobiotin synthetase
MSVFITGTDTDVGKTWIGAALVKVWRAAGIDAVGFKPVACGSREDAELLQEASERVLDLNEVNPVWFRPAVAPYTASMIDNRAVDLALMREVFALLRRRHAAVVVEGAGGWLVPILRDYSVADLAHEFGLPVVVVAANRLGVLNHTLLTVDAIRGRGLMCAGVILNQPAALPADDAAGVTNPAVLEELLRDRGVRLLGEVTHGSKSLPSALLELR